jgi:hypothetical protein
MVILHSVSYRLGYRKESPIREAGFPQLLIVAATLLGAFFVSADTT